MRIVSTIPSATETLFALDLGDSVVAVSDYCNYPQAVKQLPRIGSLNSFNIEALIELNPDYVVVLKENDLLKQRLSSLGIKTIEVDHSSLKGVLESFETLGAIADSYISGTLEKGKKLREETECKIAAIRTRAASEKSPRVLVSIYRQCGEGKIGEVYVAGNNLYYNEILEILGAQNVAGNEASAVPTMNAEGIVALAPDVIIDLATDGEEADASETTIAKRRADWDSLGSSVPAVANGAVYPILENGATIPGPRTILFIERLAEVLYPQIDD